MWAMWQHLQTLLCSDTYITCWTGRSCLVQRMQASLPCRYSRPFAFALLHSSGLPVSWASYSRSRKTALCWNSLLHCPQWPCLEKPGCPQVCPLSCSEHPLGFQLHSHLISLGFFFPSFVSPEPFIFKAALIISSLSMAFLITLDKSNFFSFSALW